MTPTPAALTTFRAWSPRRFELRPIPPEILEAHRQALVVKEANK